MSISLEFFVESTCGKSGTMVQVEDIELNADGIICCDNCKSIIACREAWYAIYGNPHKTDIQDIGRVA